MKIEYLTTFHFRLEGGGMLKKVGRVSGRGGGACRKKLAAPAAEGGAMSKMSGREAAGGGGHVEIFENFKKKPTPPHILNDSSLRYTW